MAETGGGISIHIPRWLKWLGVRSIVCKSTQHFGGQVRFVRVYWKQHEVECRWFRSKT